VTHAIKEGLANIPGLELRENVPLSSLTRFAIGGPARWLVDVSTETALIAALDVIRPLGLPHALIGGGTNLVASDAGFAGFVLRFTGRGTSFDGSQGNVEAGAVLQDLVDASIGHGLRGLETMTGIPGWVGGAIYGNAGAYGHAIQERVESVRYLDAQERDGQTVRELDRAQCEFHYRESVFKQHKDWVVLAARLRLEPADGPELKATADGILKIRNEKYPPSMRCAGSIFKNLLLSQIPEALRPQIPDRVIREGKVPAAYFLEIAGAKGMQDGDIQVAGYHANLIYNDGAGSAIEVRRVIETLKARVLEIFRLELEEEVQYL
jgi:UDP-N-acetylmuramate dehydrogenase